MEEKSSLHFVERLWPRSRFNLSTPYLQLSFGHGHLRLELMGVSAVHLHHS